MSATEMTVALVAIIAGLPLLLAFLMLVAGPPLTPSWRCQVLGRHKYYGASTAHIQRYCLRCGERRSGE